MISSDSPSADETGSDVSIVCLAGAAMTAGVEFAIVMLVDAGVVTDARTTGRASGTWMTFARTAGLSGGEATATGGGAGGVGAAGAPVIWVGLPGALTSATGVTT